ncbi:CHASE4 domain-containing protein [Clostridium saccharoperbutylacetonicum]|uniref:CHASE4 domain-containing protein n=1 Tax=Clostridium saccharoperbutylacetonicum TaxID=36745 RepID=UPI0009840496|nr:HD domain-containing phosphohydrolase [Clostridium saccharoperbutylacetonicum]AQR97809.1 cyclic di-GMP phosphodiesterase response regulator RpfG [Clostridium saccharoperbutylacetonicum]NSB33698.1 diguanylate cyclase (GGDEF)-like protein [Clostridium saccharoperbutylacetonicum]
MSIKHKTLLIGFLSMLSIIGITISIFNFSYFGYIDKEHERRLKRNFEVIDYLINKEEDNMQRLITDWGQWDDTYKFIDKPNQEFVNSNLQEETIENLNLKSIVFLDNNKKIVYSKESSVSKEFSKNIVEKLLGVNTNFNGNQGKNGLLSYKEKTYIVAIIPVTSSDKHAKSNGFIIMAREVDKNIINYIEEVAGVRLTLSDFQQENYKQNDEVSFINIDNNTVIYNKKYSEAVKIIKDINGESSISVSLIDNGYNNDQIGYFFKSFILQFLGLIVIVLIIDVLIINKYILKRLSKLTKFMEQVGKSKDTSLNIEISGKDEVYKLAAATNKMLSELNCANDEIRFLSYCDKLTKLNNRAYMEKILDELDDNKFENYFILMGDLNGLKLTNDALGHFEGDKLLVLVGKILKEICAEDDVISRWGGDEFVILVRNKDSYYVSDLIDRIKEKCNNETEFHFKISIAWGYAGYYEENSNTENVMSLAEKRMYRSKLMENKSARSAAIQSLLKTLHEKDSETEEHTIRIKWLSLKLGKKLGLTTEKLDELELLSSLHDIGKIGIPENILMKPGKLTDEEWVIMKTHCDIGYRIASSTPELAHISNKILAHHEKYDGTGYPNKLKGEEIPLLSRIISIVDSYDVMTHRRIYKETYEKEYVIEELKKCSGEQFDPYLVKEFIKLLEEENILL